MDKYNNIYMVETAMRKPSADCPCNCVTTEFPNDTVVAMAYVPFQGVADDIYTCDKALVRGSLFPCLDKPFTMGCCK